VPTFSQKLQGSIEIKIVGRQKPPENDAAKQAQRFIAKQ